MKKTFLTFMMTLVVMLVFGQTVFYSETMGIVSGTTAIAAHETANGFDVDSATYSGTADVRVSTVSTGYTGASGSANVFITSTVGRYLLVEGIDSSAHSGITMTLGHHKSTTAGNNELKIEVSSDGTSWTQLTYSRPTGAGTSSWLLIEPAGTIPSATNLRIRFTQTSTLCQFRVDDITLTETVSSSTSITNIVQTPSTGITSSTTVSVSATITDSDGTVELAELSWGTIGGSLTHHINMSKGTGDTWVTDTPIPAQAKGTTVYYEIYAMDDDAGETTSAEYSYTVPANIQPSITNITLTPSSDITSATTVSVSATITDSDGTVELVELSWGTSSGSLTGNINMSKGTGNIWVTDTLIPAQANNTTVYYEIYALDDDADETTSAEHIYTVTDPVPDAPVSTDATATTDNSFTANWDSVQDATGYRLDVYQSSSNSGILAEGFEGASTATPPTDWTLSADGSYIIGTAANAYSGTNYAGMNKNNGWVQTPLISNPTSCTFWARTSASSANFTAKVQSSPDGTDWTDQATYTATPTDAGTVTSTYTEKSIDLNLTGDYYLRWVITARSGGSFYFDDVSISFGSKTYVDGYENLDVGNVTSYNVTGLTQGTTYYYVVRAYNNNGTSGNSNESTTTETLPVELSSFTVALSSTNQAVLTWVTQTETGVSGFYIYRNTDYDLASAELISNLIPATNSSQQKVYIYRDKELSAAGTYYYWLQVADLDGSESYHGPVNLVYAGGDNQQSPGIPEITTLKNIYPNPFNPSTTISYGLDKTANVSIKIYNSRGQMVRSFEEGSKNAGYYNLTWNGDDDSGRTLSTGVYYIRMQAGNKSLNKKAVLMK